MLTSQSPSPLLRAFLLAFSIMTVGSLIGFGWEMGVHGDVLEEEQALEELMEAEGRAESLSPDWRKGPSEEEREIIQRATSGLPPYKDAVPQALAADYLDPSSKLAAAWFMTPDSPQEVVGFYREALAKAGLPTVEHFYNSNAGYVAYMEPRSRRVHTVSVLAQGGETAVFVSAGQVASFLEGGNAVPAGLPMPPEVEAPVVLTFRREGRIQYSVMAELPEGQVKAVSDFYRESFAVEGWRLESASEESVGETHLQVSRGDSRATALVQQQGAGVKLYVTLDQPL
ncbi:hypothetical protein F0U60_46015 [Archangium minus]|uniref:Uncharacterized protein n=1 Tax=Archangium minus TaxID=83450 RepID=A0ABY9X5J4_9BACT|nr:hypothetical protein F0U61_46145 [Archangium violaceum]WNG50671.1 hypothetical protein F0U60_46015 [Archangium minus]